MSTFITMLRGINVSGLRKIPMEELRGLYEAMSLANVKTYVQSGNVVFDSEEEVSSRLVERIEAQIEQVYGYNVPVLIRGTDEFKRGISGNPLLKGMNEDPAQLHVTFLYSVPSEKEMGVLTPPIGEGEELAIGEKEIYLYFPNGYGRTKLNNNYFERKLGIPATTRNWKTVKALYEMAKER